MSSLTWQELPPDLLEPVMAQALSLVEASELFDLILMHPDQTFEVPPHLNEAAGRLMLWAVETEPTRH